MKTYYVNKTERDKSPLFEKESRLWEKANVLTDFKSPWDSKDVKIIEFKALHDSEKLFFYFKVHDSEVYIHPSEDANDSINNSDRVELFFRSDAEMNPYYCLEIDSMSRIMDFIAKPVKNFDFNWNWPSKDIEVKSSINKMYFVVEGSVSLKSLKEFGLLKNGKIETGIYRAKYNKQLDDTYEATWITWIDPMTPTPNFHIGTSFGVLELKNT